MGKPKANDEGIQSLLNWIRTIVNPQVVQGNFPTDSPSHSTMYENYVFWNRVDLAQMVVVNLYKWNLNTKDANVIIDSIMNMIEPFMTRLIDNKERESYEATIQHKESTTTPNENTGLLGGLFKH